MTEELIIPGDTIAVRHARFMRHDVWTAAEVFAVDGDRISAAFTEGKDKGKFIALERSQENRTWRRA